MDYINRGYNKAKEALIGDCTDPQVKRKKMIIFGSIILAIIILIIIIIIIACSGGDDDETKNPEEDHRPAPDYSKDTNHKGTPQSYCNCPSSQKTPKEIVNDPNFTPTEIVIDGNNYGKPFLLGGLIFLFKEVTLEKSSTALTDPCPTGFRLPKKIEYESMLKSLGTNAYTELHNKSGFNFQTGKKYMTSDKVNPSKTSGSDSDAWTYYGLAESGQTYSIQSVNSYFSTSDMVGKCIQDLTTVKINIDGTNPDLIVNEKRKLTLDRSTLKGFWWRIDNKLYNETSVVVENNNRGCNLVEVWGNAMNDQQIYSCNIIYTRVQEGNSVESSFTLAKVSELSTTFSSPRVRYIYFERPQAPIAPKVNGGYYLAYCDSNTKVMHVVEFDKSDTIVKDFSSPYKAYPLDIIETDYGFAIYARLTSDEDHSFIVTYNFDYTKRAQTTIMNNGEEPTTFKEGIVFYNQGGEPLYGTALMYQPHNGKLAFGKGKLNLIFAHYNNFGGYGGHSGDTYYSFEIKGDSDSAKYAWSWATSHSLIQSHIYDGRHFLTASLGDAHPEGINLGLIDIEGKSTIMDSKRKKLCNIPNNLKIITSIPGNQSGNSLGRLGQLMNFGSFYALVYSVKVSTKETRDGIFLMTLKKEGDTLNIIKEYKVLSGAGKLINLRCARYGKRILITYILDKKDYGNNYIENVQDLEGETMYYLLVDTNGNVKAGPLQAKTQHQAINEDIRPLADGSLRWGYVDTMDVLRIVKIEAPS